jgi:hypothetical protein
MTARRTCASTTTRSARARRRHPYLIAISREFIGGNPPQIATDKGIAVDTGSVTFVTREGNVGKHVLAASVAAGRRKAR